MCCKLQDIDGISGCVFNKLDAAPALSARKIKRNANMQVVELSLLRFSCLWHQVAHGVGIFLPLEPSGVNMTLEVARKGGRSQVQSAATRYALQVATAGCRQQRFRKGRTQGGQSVSIVSLLMLQLLIV